MTKATNDGNWYSNVFKTWQAKQLGPKPTADMLASIHNLGARPGKQALASAMALRACGVTAGQIVIACGNPQLNKMRGFINDALLKREAVPPSAEGHTVYKLSVTAKGQQRIARTVKAKGAVEAEGNKAVADKPAKPAKAVSKATEATGQAGAQAAVEGALNAGDNAQAAEQPQA